MYTHKDTYRLTNRDINICTNTQADTDTLTVSRVHPHSHPHVKLTVVKSTQFLQRTPEV